MLRFRLHRLVSSFGRGARVALLVLPSLANAGTAGPTGGAYVWALDVMAPNGQHNLLMGTMHVPDRHLRQPDPRVLRSYRVVVTEHPDVNEGPAPAVRWRDALTPGDIAMLRQQIACFAPPLLSPVQIETVLTFVLGEPTTLEANQIAYQRCASAGYAARDDIVRRAGERYGLTPACAGG